MPKGKDGKATAGRGDDMNLLKNRSLSPDFAKLLMALLGVVLAVVSWNVLTKRINDLRYEQVLGEHHAVDVAAAREDLAVLPIVVANSLPNQSALPVTNDMLIESAFRKPEPVVVPASEQEAPRERVYTLAQQLVARYRPSVSAITNGGAFINGAFWQQREAILNMPIVASTGQKLYPMIAQMTDKSVTLAIADETLLLSFDQY